MKIFRHGALRVIAAAILLFSVAFSATACKQKTDGKTGVDALISAWEKAEKKKSETSAQITLKYYGAGGAAGTVGQRLKISRVQADGRYYASFSAATSAFSPTAIVSQFLNAMPEEFADVKKYLTNSDSSVRGEIGLYGDTLNARADFYPSSSYSPDYAYTLKGKTYNLFAALKTADITAFLDESGVAEFGGLDVGKALAAPLVFPFDYSSMTDEGSASFNRASKTYAYTYNVTTEFLKKYAADSVAAVIETNFAGTDRYAEAKRIYDTYKDTVLSWFTVNGFAITIEADAYGNPVSFAASGAIRVYVPDSDVGKFTAEMGYSEEETTQLLTALHIVLAASDSAKATEFSVSFDVKETYSFDKIAIDSKSPLFASFSDNIDGRFKAEYAYDAETEGKRWKITGFER